MDNTLGNQLSLNQATYVTAAAELKENTVKEIHASQHPFARQPASEPCQKCVANSAINESKDNLIKVLNEYVEALKRQNDKYYQKDKLRKMKKSARLSS